MYFIVLFTVCTIFTIANARLGKPEANERTITPLDYNSFETKNITIVSASSAEFCTCTCGVAPAPTFLPTAQPTDPTPQPTNEPQPTDQPTFLSTPQPTSVPTVEPTTAEPTFPPSKKPSTAPTKKSVAPTMVPSAKPTFKTPWIPLGSSLNSGLVASYLFQNGTAHDSGPNAYHGTVIGIVKPHSNRYGVPQKAMHINGQKLNGFISIPPYSGAFAFNSSFSFAVWLNPAPIQPTNFGNVLDKCSGGPLNSGWMFNQVATTQPSYGLSVTLTDGTRPQASPATFPGYAWTHVAVVKSGTSISTYVNGTISSTSSVGRAKILEDPNTYLTVGVEQACINYDAPSLTNTGYQFDGAMDDLYFYNRALTSSEVSTLFALNP